MQGSLALAPPAYAPNAVRTLASITLPDAPPPPARRVVRVHFTPFAPGIPQDAALGDPCRWATYGGVTPVLVMAALCERLAYRPWDLNVRDSAADEVLVYLADPGAPLAIVWEGLTSAEARDALRNLATTWRARS